MKIQLTGRILLLLSLFLINASYAVKPVKNIINEPIPTHIDGSHPSLEMVRKAIINGCKDKGWVPTSDGANRIKATILVRGQHFAQIEIPYTKNAYSIIYRSSKNLKYNHKNRTIHRNYNKWASLLSGAIYSNLELKT